jgi:type I site-specific restriction endonuclease
VLVQQFRYRLSYHPRNGSWGQRRILLVMATGTGKTYTAFQIIWRLWKSGAAKRILFLVDRNILADQAKTNDFKPFGQALTKIQNRQADKSYEVYLALYQAVSGTDEAKNIYRQFSPDFFDLVVIDECHRGSAREDAAWHGILDYFTSAVHIGLTATPKETADVSNSHYFGDPVYTYSLRQGIEDGFLAPYKVIRVDLDKDLFGWRPAQGKTDKHGELIEDRIYNQRDMDRTLVLEQRTNLVARRTTEFLESNDRFAKTIVFCEDIDHAERMRQALVNQNGDLVAANRKYVMRITGDEQEGKAELDNFIDPESSHPDYTRRNLRQTYASLDDFLATWSAAGKKKAIVEALEEQGVLWEPLAEEVGKDLDPFDLICHVAFGQPPLTRRERAERVRKRDVFTKYGDQARLVIDALLDKYADQGIEDLESTAVLKVPPFDRFGTPIEIVRLFGGRVGFEAALSDLKQTLYTE